MQKDKIWGYQYSIFLMVIFAALLFMFQSIYLLGNKNIIGKDDPTYYFSYVRSLVVDHDLDLKNEYEHFGIYAYSTTPLGRPVNVYSFGLPLLVSPFYLVTHAILSTLSSAGFSVSTDGYGLPYQLVFSLAGIFYGMLGLSICYSMLSIYFNKKTTTLSVVTIMLCSNLFYYFEREPFMSELCSFFIVSLFFYLWHEIFIRVKSTCYYWFGLCAGMMVIVRQQNIGYFLVTAISTLVFIRSSLGTLLPRRAYMVVAGIIIAVVPQMVVWQFVFGSPLVYSYGEQTFIYKFEPKLLQVLFSSKHGLISWHPIVIFCLVGLLMAVRKYKVLSITFISCFLLQLYINSSWVSWWFGYSFGHRGFIGCSLFFCFGLAFLFSQDFMANKQVISYMLVGLLACWNMLLMLAYLSGMVPMEGYFSWLDLFNNLYDLPSHVLGKIQQLR